MKKFLLLDTHSLIFRAYFAFIKNPLKNSKGQNTSGIYGFLNTFKRIKAKFKSEYICLVFDAPGETFRDKLFKEYKATRPPAPRDIPFQVEKTKEIAKSLGIRIFEVPGFEADDVLATLARKLQNFGEVYIISSDKDLLQLINGNIYVYDAFNDIVFDRNRVIEKFNVLPQRIGDYLALCGDTIDNIPGVPGIGPQRAKEILNKYPNLQEALEKEPKLTRYRETLLLSKKLVELKINVPVDIQPEDLIPREPNSAELLTILSDLEFHSLIREFAKQTEPQITLTAIDVSELQVKDHIGIVFNNDKVYISVKDDEVSVTDLNHSLDIISNPKTTKIGYDLKDTIKAIPINSPIFDIKICSWLIDPNIKNDKFEDICLRYLNQVVEPKPEVIASISLKLYPIMKNRLEELGELDLYKNVEEPLIFVLAQMEKRGIGIDIPFLSDLKKQLNKRMVNLIEECYKIAGSRFNINSPKQLAQVLFERLKLPPVKMGKSHYSTNFEVLQQLSSKHELPRKIVEYRELAKILSTYIEPLMTLAKNNRVYTTFNQTGTVTGRLSSNNPNIQNIPIRSTLGNELRKAFIAQKGFLLISADYSQIELRILAHITKDKNLMDAFKSNRDIHNHTASMIFNKSEENISEHERRIAKVVNYGLIYGMSDYGLAQELGISREEANQFIQSYYTLYPGVEEWRTQAISNAEEKGYAETVFGRKRPIPEIKSENHNIKEAAKRFAINTPIQGTAADLIKLAMITAERKLNNLNFKRGLLLSIHDELLFEIEEERIAEAKEIIKEVMEQVCKFEVPIAVDINAGKNWAEAH
ncbi:MAG: DNA polymerase I [bacterium]